MSTLIAYPGASYYQTLLAIGYATDNNDGSKLDALKPIAEAYKGLAQALAALPVPQTLAPLHLQILNNIARMAQTYDDMQMLIADPLRGLSGLQLYQSLMDETTRVFTNIAQQLQSNGILFDTSEPGNTWSSLLP
jgi:hypothetical protein